LKVIYVGTVLYGMCENMQG